jgi:glycosyltransferase involved in cell wall biosynthesis
MTARANQTSMASLLKKVERGDKLNIFTFATHERYEENLCKTGHNFYSFKYGKEWDETYAPVPDNYHIVDYVPESIDIILSHTSCNRLQVAHDLISGTRGSATNQLAIPILRHCHVLPDIRFDVEKSVESFKEIPVNLTSFISNYSRDAWGYSSENSKVVEHGVDTEFWGELYYPKTMLYQNPLVLSVVNEFPSRDWCCGFELWKEVASDPAISCQVVGKCTGEHAGFSKPAESTEQLREFYQTAAVFLNTSIHSPVPTVMMEAMACGCPVVTTGTCMIPEIIEHGVNGIIAKDAADMKFWCRELLEKPDLARKIGEAGRKTIQQKYNLQRFVDNWNDLLYSTIGEYNEGLLRCR